MATRPIDGATPSLSRALFPRLAGLEVPRHGHARELAAASGSESARDLADLVHLLCTLHCNHPGLLGHALSVCAPGEVGGWLAEACRAFELERTYVVGLTAAVGPIPSTPGAAESEAALSFQRNALETLATSERPGCAAGAAIMFAIQWHELRPLLDRAAERVGIDPPPLRLPDLASAAAALELAAGDEAARRAVGFGAEQLLLQHRALFDLLEARASARRDM